jgi:hypothetical protein
MGAVAAAMAESCKNERREGLGNSEGLLMMVHSWLGVSPFTVRPMVPGTQPPNSNGAHLHPV